MIELITMLLSVVGPAGMGSGLKIAAGLVDRFAAAGEAREKREILREIENAKIDNETLNAINGTDGGGRYNRRIALVIGMSTFAVCQVLCVLYPSALLLTFNSPESLKGFSVLWGFFNFPTSSDTTVTLTTGHMAIMGFQMMSMMFGFYFTPGGRK